jgi:hypothetical protein
MFGKFLRTISTLICGLLKLQVSSKLEMRHRQLLMLRLLLLNLQAIVDAEVTAAQSAWDANNVEGETAEQKIERIGNRPADITLGE